MSDAGRRYYNAAGGFLDGPASTEPDAIVDLVARVIAQYEARGSQYADQAYSFASPQRRGELGELASVIVAALRDVRVNPRPSQADVDAALRVIGEPEAEV